MTSFGLGPKGDGKVNLLAGAAWTSWSPIARQRASKKVESFIFEGGRTGEAGRNLTCWICEVVLPRLYRMKLDTEARASCHIETQGRSAFLKNNRKEFTLWVHWNFELEVGWVKSVRCIDSTFGSRSAVSPRSFELERIFWYSEASYTFDNSWSNPWQYGYGRKKLVKM